MKTILCIGAGYVGGPTMAVMAKHCTEYRVIVVDVDEAKIRAWQSDSPPIFESMIKPAFVFDGRNLLDHRMLHELGFNVYPVGKAPMTHIIEHLQRAM